MLLSEKPVVMGPCFRRDDATNGACHRGKLKAPAPQALVQETNPHHNPPIV
jgi:hypothetical protein